MMFGRYLLQKLLAPRCCLCGLSCNSLEVPFCEHCYNDLPLWVGGCSCCGMPLRSAGEGLLCGSCQSKPKPFDNMCLLAWYADAVPKLIGKFKYHNNLKAGYLLSKSWLKHQQNLQLPQVLIPVPIHPYKLAQRGFNQAAFIADVFAKDLNLPVDLDVCQKILHTKASVKLNRKERLAQVKKLYKTNICLYEHVAIVDDVVTTQATVTILAQQLRKQGVKRVDVWALARTL